jgi:antitoxin HicB
MPRAKSEYPVLLRKLSKAEGGGYLAEFPDLPGCMADGPTAAEALIESQDALKSYLASVKKHGDKLPAPGESVWRQRAPRSLHRLYGASAGFAIFINLSRVAVSPSDGFEGTMSEA